MPASRAAEGWPRKVRIEAEMFQIVTAALQPEQSTGCSVVMSVDELAYGAIELSLRSAYV